MTADADPFRIEAAPLRVNAAGRHRAEPGWQLTPARTRRWPDLDLWVLLEGRGHVRGPDGDHPLEQGTALLMRGGEDYQLDQERGAPIVHYWVHFDVLDDAGVVRDFRALPLPPRHRRLRRPSLLFELLERLVEEQRAPAPDPTRAAAWLRAALLEVTRADARQPAESASAIADAIDRLCARIRQSPADAPSVERMAEELAVSRGHFCRAFRRQTGTSPRAFVTAARMQEARNLLLESSHGVGRIAAMVGYGDIYFFSRHFKSHHGVSPMRYRRGER